MVNTAHIGCYRVEKGNRSVGSDRIAACGMNCFRLGLAGVTVIGKSVFSS